LPTHISNGSRRKCLFSEFYGLTFCRPASSAFSEASATTPRNAMTKWKFVLKGRNALAERVIKLTAAASPQRTDLCDPVRIKLERCFASMVID
jgi:hypothetical protein